nr:phosphoadenosine phosphosulfate reductase family protein [Candidatus Burkholderia verschuerenii]
MLPLPSVKDVAAVVYVLGISRRNTSEFKSAVIFSALKKRFPTQDIVNVTGVRRQESSARSKMPVSAPLASLSTKGRAGITWNAIIEWTIEEVFAEIASAGLALHEAYTVYGASRVSCAYCIMSTLDGLASRGKLRGQSRCLSGDGTTGSGLDLRVPRSALACRCCARTAPLQSHC